MKRFLPLFVLLAAFAANAADPAPATTPFTRGILRATNSADFIGRAGIDGIQQGNGYGTNTTLVGVTLGALPLLMDTNMGLAGVYTNGRTLALPPMNLAGACLPHQFFNVGTLDPSLANTFCTAAGRLDWSWFPGIWGVQLDITTPTTPWWRQNNSDGGSILELGREGFTVHAAKTTLGYGLGLHGGKAFQVRYSGANAGNDSWSQWNQPVIQPYRPLVFYDQALESQVDGGNAWWGGITNPFVNMFVSATSAPTNGVLHIANASTVQGGAPIMFVRGRGVFNSDTVPALGYPTLPAVAGDTNVAIMGVVLDSDSKIQMSAGIYSVVESTPTSGHAAQQLHFFTGTATTDAVPRMTISSTGDVYFANAIKGSGLGITNMPPTVRYSGVNLTVPGGVNYNAGYNMSPWGDFSTVVAGTAAMLTHPTTISNLYGRLIAPLGAGTNVSVYLITNGVVNSNFFIAFPTAAGANTTRTNSTSSWTGNVGDNYSWFYYSNTNGVIGLRISLTYDESLR